MIELSLPLPNSANTHWRHGRGITYLSKQGKDYRYLVANAVADIGLPQPLDGRLSVSMVVCPRDKRKMDIDNRVKPLLDALQHAGLFVDDSQIDQLYVERGPVVTGGKCLIKIVLINPARE